MTSYRKFMQGIDRGDLENFLAFEREKRRSREKPYLHTIQAGVVLPLLQAVITGGLGGIVLLVLSVKFRWRDAWLHALLFWLIVTALTWLYLQRHWLLMAFERITGADLNRDGRIGGDLHEAATPVVRVKLDEIKENRHFQQHTYNIPATLDQMAELAKGVLEQEIAFSERSWAGSGKPFSSAEFRNLRSELIRRDLVVLANPKDSRLGYAFTAKGRAVLRGFLDESSPPPLEFPDDV